MQSQSFFKRWSQPVLVAGATALLVSTSALADDTEVFEAQIKASAPPNLLFTLDYSGSMGNPINKGDTGAADKIDILKSAVRAVLINNAGDVNIGIGSLYSGTPSGVKWPISDLTADANTIDSNIPAGVKTVADVLSDQLDTRPAQGGTATVDALAEAAAYFRGAEVYHNGVSADHPTAHISGSFNPNTGAYIPGGKDAAIAASYTPVNANQTGWSGGNYISPINAECGVNAVILVSDGEPTVRDNQSQIDELLGHGEDDCKDLNVIFGASQEPNATKGAIAGRCGPEIAAQLAENPQIPGIPDSIVRTYTVGFATEGAGADYLEAVATAGRGEFFEASSPESLSDALNNILTELITTSQSFVPLAVDVDRANFSHENRLFYSLFKPSRNTSWGGNLKGYFFGENGLTDINNNEATELYKDVRVMRDDAQSFWSRTPDGEDVTEGGASALLADGNRRLLTYTGDNDIPSIGVSLTANGNHNLVAGNDAVTDAMLGGTGNRNKLLNELQTAPMGDPLHSQPVQVNYGNERVIYVMTNQGFLHAIDATTPVTPNGDNGGGEEIFAFMPPELLNNVPKHFSGEITPNRTYGLDGALIRWHDDENLDGIVNGSDTVLLVFGMRRGGTHYYAVDVTDPTSPRYMWRIDGGSSEFPKLGETWSRPSLVKVMKNGKETDVLAFGGGYNAAELDGTINNKEVDTGNAIYMVDREGDKVWSVDGNSVAEMDYAIPSDLTIVDINGDDVMDRIYVGDLGGNIWRIDFDDIEDGASAEVLATLNDFGDQTFFYPPSVALNSSSELGDFISVSIGSGNRTNPLRLNSNGHIFMIRDRYVKDALPNNFNTIKANDLHDATLNPIGDENDNKAANAREDLNTSEGWYIRLDDHEKVLSQLVTFEGRLLGTTFGLEESQIADACEPPGENRFYQMDLATAQPLKNNTADGDTQANLIQGGRGQRVNGDGILSQPTVMFPPNGNEVSIIVDNEIVSTFTQDFTRIFWHSQ